MGFLYFKRLIWSVYSPLSSLWNGWDERLFWSVGRGIPFFLGGGGRVFSHIEDEVWTGSSSSGKESSSSVLIVWMVSGGGVGSMKMVAGVVGLVGMRAIFNPSAPPVGEGESPT